MDDLIAEIQRLIDKEFSRQLFLTECISGKHRTEIPESELNAELLTVIGRIQAYRYSLELIKELPR